MTPARCAPRFLSATLVVTSVVTSGPGLRLVASGAVRRLTSHGAEDILPVFRGQG